MQPAIPLAWPVGCRAIAIGTLYGLTLFHELMSVERAGIGLALLAELIAAGKLQPRIAIEAPWGEIGAIARRLIDRDFAGKAVLHI